ncbi:phage scaffolding protein [Kozakia baliensis]|uniref:Uncharacterized protein n=1 Tax=Kozakia baliensis TaxID=153496 RepID=A0A1D8UVQ6_9PROT|nr:hypothetical protein [Kozakia baliensis]AOX17721.1 hypothetical protein A0U89_11865 [Kozakia baliensis]GBR31650.1 phage minor structual protein GP20 [Kozakia baliensis NRIC 0488]GEL62764.1 hypothetical protein KBA01_00500 [Kozakia baliensis]
MTDDIESLRQSLEAAQVEMAALRENHAADLLRVRKETDAALIEAELRAEAMRAGAHHPEDAVKLMDRGEVVRDEEGRIAGAAAAIERLKKERGYLFALESVSGVSSGTTLVRSVPRPGVPEAFDARKATEADYNARKWQLLSGR